MLSRVARKIGEVSGSSAEMSLDSDRDARLLGGQLGHADGAVEPLLREEVRREGTSLLTKVSSFARLKLCERRGCSAEESESALEVAFAQVEGEVDDEDVGGWVRKWSVLAVGRVI